MIISRVRAVLFALCVSVLSSVVSAQQPWEWVFPNPTANRVASFAYGAGKFVGISSGGEIVASPDSITWKVTAQTLDLRYVVFDGQQFVAGGKNKIWRSPDAVTWTEHTAPAEVLGLAVGQSFLVALARVPNDREKNRLMSSADGVEWTVHELACSPYLLASANGLVVALDSGGKGAVSADGKTWTPVVVPVRAAAALAHFVAGNGRFLAAYQDSQGSRTYGSTDGIAWSDVTQQLTDSTQTFQVPDVGYLSSMGFAGGKFYVRQQRYSYRAYWLYCSTDGLNWQPSEDSMHDLDLSTLAGGGDARVASVDIYHHGGYNSNRHVIHSSVGGKAWVARTTSTVTAEEGPVYALGRFFYGGKISHDGLTWADTPFRPTHGAGDLAFRITTKLWGTSVVYEAYPGGTTSVEVSADGVSFASVDVKMEGPRAVAFGAGRYVVVGNGGHISTSTDGTHWASASSGTTNHLLTVTYGSGQFLAGGEGGTLLTSADGLTWAAVSVPELAGLDVRCVQSMPDGFLVATKQSTVTIPVKTLPGNIRLRFVTEHGFGTLAQQDGKYFGSVFSPRDYGMPGMIPELWMSNDGQEWTNVSVVLPSAYDGGRAFVVASPTIALFSAPWADGYSISTSLLLRNAAAASLAPEITHDPMGQSVHRGETAYFSFGVRGSGRLSYQWYHGSDPIADANGPVLKLVDLRDAAAGDYTVRVTNEAGAATSAKATLTVLEPVPLTITQQPVGGTLLEFTSFVLEVGVSGSGPVTYQWRRNGQPVSGATGPRLELYTASYSMDNYVGTYDVMVTAPFSTATSEAVEVKRSGPVVSVSLGGSTAWGGTVTVTANATGKAPFTYEWGRAGGYRFTGANSSVLVLPNLTSADSSSYSVTVKDADGHSGMAFFIVSVTGEKPAGPTRVQATAGQDITLRAPVVMGWGYTYEWRFNGAVMSGVSTSSHTLHGVSSADEGNYEIIATASDGTVTRESFSLTLQRSRLTNLSARGVAGSGEDSMIQGFVLSGSAPADGTNLLVRSVGPGLDAMKVTGALGNPNLRVLDRQQLLIAENDDWCTPVAKGIGAAASAPAMNRVGAFALADKSRDAAVEICQPRAGAYTALCDGGSTAGIVLTEIYGVPDSPQRLINLSARARVSTGDAILIAGFVINGTSPMRVLLRAVGPGLAPYGVVHPLTDPKLTLFDRQGHALLENDTWASASNVAELRAAATQVGAFTLSDQSKDAAILVELQPGVYTMHVNSVDGTSGVALAEIYEVP